MKLDSCRALITGASAGIGREFARQLAGRARSLILVARREERLNQLRDELRQQHPNLTVHIRKADLADLAQLKELKGGLSMKRLMSIFWSTTRVSAIAVRSRLAIPDATSK